MSLRAFVIDCDTGRDDALTLWFAVKQALPLVGVIASYGNTTLANVIDNTARVLSLVGGDAIPLIAGLDRPIGEHRLYQPVVITRQGTSGNGLCNITFPTSSRGDIKPNSPQEMARAVEALARTHGKLDYFIIGPASNCAAIADVLGESFKDVVARITMMGGKLDPLWSEMPGPDFNIASDPHALASVMRTGVPFRFLPMNATWPIQMALTDIEALVPQSALAQNAKDLMIAHCRHFAPEPVFRFHDPSILLAAMHPEAFTRKKLRLITDEGAEDFGRLIESEDGIDCEVYATDTVSQGSIRKAILLGLGFAFDQ